MNAKNDGNSNETGEQNKLTEPAVMYGKEPQAMETQDELYEKVMNYWPVLTIEKKKVILDLMRVFVEDEEPVDIPKEEWEIMMKERDDYINGIAKTYSWAQVREMMHDKEKRDDVRN